METRISYAAVGAFVIMLGTALMGLGLWLGSDVTATEYKRYSAFFSESVAGLSPNAAVRYHGVRVGRVDQIALADQDPSQVHVVLAVAEDTPIKEDTVARLDIQGLTGLASIELGGGSPAAPLLVSENGPPYPVIETRPSLLVRLDQALSEGLGAMEGLAARLEHLLSDDNIARVGNTLENVEQFTAALAAERDTLVRTLADARRFSANAAAASEELPALVQEIDRTLDQFQQLSQRLGSAGQEVADFAQTGQQGMEHLADRTLPRVDATLERVQALSRNLERLSRELADNPEMLIYGRPTPPPGPGE